MLVDQRKHSLQQWVASKLNDTSINLIPLSGDASFRRYFYLSSDGQAGHSQPLPPLLAIDAPPELINNTGFIEIASLLSHGNVRVPNIAYQDLDAGFFLVENLGNRLLLEELNQQSKNNQTFDAKPFYIPAIETLLNLQSIPVSKLGNIPSYDAQFLQFEMGLFRDWFVDKHLQLELSADDHQIIESAFNQLTLSALEQNQVLVHRDFHSRNIILMQNNEVGVIDYQDAVVGPITYDLVSLLKDCYFELPNDQLKKLAKHYWERATKAGTLVNSFDNFYQQFEWMGLQRHIKVLGIFCRLNYRDDKPQYLNDLPLTFHYVVDACRRYSVFQEFTELLESRIKPTFEAKQASLK